MPKAPKEQEPTEHPSADPYVRATGDTSGAEATEAPTEDAEAADEAVEASEGEAEGVGPTA